VTASGKTKRELRSAEIEALEEELVAELRDVNASTRAARRRARALDFLREPIAFTIALLVGVALWRWFSFEAAVIGLLACTYAKATISRPSS